MMACLDDFASLLASDDSSHVETSSVTGDESHIPSTVNESMDIDEKCPTMGFELNQPGLMYGDITSMKYEPSLSQSQNNSSVKCNGGNTSEYSYAQALIDQAPRLTASNDLDKSSVLRLAQAYITLQQGLQSWQTMDPSVKRWPKVLEDGNLASTAQAAMRCFILIVTSQGNIVFVSDAVESLLGYEQLCLVGQPVHSIIHKDELPVLAAQFSMSSSTGRSFYSRMLNKSKSSATQQVYDLVQVVGHLQEVGLSANSTGLDKKERWLMCACRVLTSLEEAPGSDSRSREWVSHHKLDGSLLHIDSRSCHVSGYLPTEALNMPAYCLVHPDDLEHVAFCHNQALTNPKGSSCTYRMYTKSQAIVYVSTHIQLARDKISNTPKFLFFLNRVIDEKEGNEQISRHHQAVMWVKPDPSRKFSMNDIERTVNSLEMEGFGPRHVASKGGMMNSCLTDSCTFDGSDLLRWNLALALRVSPTSQHVKTSLKHNQARSGYHKIRGYNDDSVKMMHHDFPDPSDLGVHQYQHGQHNHYGQPRKMRQRGTKVSHHPYMKHNIQSHQMSVNHLNETASNRYTDLLMDELDPSLPSVNCNGTYMKHPHTNPPGRPRGRSRGRGRPRGSGRGGTTRGTTRGTGRGRGRTRGRMRGNSSLHVTTGRGSRGRRNSDNFSQLTNQQTTSIDLTTSQTSGSGYQRIDNYAMRGRDINQSSMLPNETGLPFQQFPSFDGLDMLDTESDYHLKSPLVDNLNKPPRKKRKKYERVREYSAESFDIFRDEPFDVLSSLSPTDINQTFPSSQPGFSHDFIPQLSRDVQTNSNQSKSFPMNRSYSFQDMNNHSNMPLSVEPDAEHSILGNLLKGKGGSTSSNGSKSPAYALIEQDRSPMQGMYNNRSPARSCKSPASFPDRIIRSPAHSMISEASPRSVFSPEPNLPTQTKEENCGPVDQIDLSTPASSTPPLQKMPADDLTPEEQEKPKAVAGMQVFSLQLRQKHMILEKDLVSQEKQLRLLEKHMQQASQDPHPDSVYSQLNSKLEQIRANKAQQEKELKTIQATFDVHLKQYQMSEQRQSQASPSTNQADSSSVDFQRHRIKSPPAPSTRRMAIVPPIQRQTLEDGEVPSTSSQKDNSEPTNLQKDILIQDSSKPSEESLKQSNSSGKDQHNQAALLPPPLSSTSSPSWNPQTKQHTYQSLHHHHHHHYHHHHHTVSQQPVGKQQTYPEINSVVKSFSHQPPAYNSSLSPSMPTLSPIASSAATSISPTSLSINVTALPSSTTLTSPIVCETSPISVDQSPSCASDTSSGYHSLSHGTDVISMFTKHHATEGLSISTGQHFTRTPPTANSLHGTSCISPDLLSLTPPATTSSSHINSIPF